MNLQSTITCPNCGGVKTETMPTDACQFFYKCANCTARLKPKAGDCCVFCSYGDVPCPPIQEGLCCKRSAEVTNGTKNLGWLSLPISIAAAVALLAAGGAVCMFCL